MTKDELKSKLDELEIEYPSDANKADLEALLPAEEAGLAEVVQEDGAKKESSRHARWEKFLEDYKIQNPVRYERLKKDGEFNKIPESFV